MNKINMRKLKFLHKEFAFNLLPNISFFLNLNPKEGVKRSLSIKKTEIKYEKKENRFHEKIRTEFENLSKKDKHLINVDASNSIESIHRKIINILNENNFNKEDCILITRTFLNKSKKILELSTNFKVNKNIELTISSAKPPIFWKDKEITKQQIYKWTPENITKLIYKLNDLELQIKKNIDNSINLITDFILEQSSPRTNN